MKEIKPLKTNALNVRFDDETFRVMEEIERETSIEKVGLVRAAVIALTAHWRVSRAITLPLKIVSSDPLRHAASPAPGAGPDANVKRAMA